MPLQKNDIQRESWKTDDIVSESHDAFYVFSTTKVTQGAGRSPYDPSNDEVDTPFRDGAHSLWDSKVLNNMPIYATCNGRATKVEPVER